MKIFNSDKSNRYHVKLWYIVNSPFVIFLLSALLISYLPSYYAKKQLEEKNKNERKILANKLDLEISARLNRYHILLVNAQCKNDIYEAHKLLNTFIVFPEFSRHSLKSLLWQLENIVSKDEQRFILHAIYGYDLLYDKSLSMANKYDSTRIKDIIHGMLINYLSKYFHGRNWLRYSFKQ